jgi:hypothetical protein
MKIYIQAEKIFVANQAIDFRKSIDGICAMIINLLDEDPGEGMNSIFFVVHIKD